MQVLEELCSRAPGLEEVHQGRPIPRASGALSWSALLSAPSPRAYARALNQLAQTGIQTKQHQQEGAPVSRGALHFALAGGHRTLNNKNYNLQGQVAFIAQALDDIRNGVTIGANTALEEGKKSTLAVSRALFSRPLFLFNKQSLVSCLICEYERVVEIML